MPVKSNNEFAMLKADLSSMGWKSPNDYGSDFDIAGDFPAIYLFLNVVNFEAARVLYVGMSGSLSARLSSHPVLRSIRKDGPLYVQTWFKRVDGKCLRESEKSYIEKYDPPLNTMHKPKKWWS